MNVRSYDAGMREGDVAGRLMTFAEAAKLDPDTHAGELDGGRWVPVTKNTWMHGVIVTNVAMALRLYAKKNREWIVSSGDPGTMLGHAPDILRGPDVGMVRAARFPTGSGEAGWLENAPELVVEVKGDSQTFGELMKKVFEYLGAGALLVWVVNPESQTVVSFSPGKAPQLAASTDVLDGGEAFPGLQVPVAELFER
jgi:Uma2 family endonuclease